MILWFSLLLYLDRKIPAHQSTTNTVCQLAPWADYQYLGYICPSINIAQLLNHTGKLHKSNYFSGWRTTWSLRPGAAAKIQRSLYSPLLPGKNVHCLEVWICNTVSVGNMVTQSSPLLKQFHVAFFFNLKRKISNLGGIDREKEKIFANDYKTGWQVSI